MAGVGSDVAVGPLPDPKDMIALGHRAEIAMGLITRKGMDAAIETLKTLQREHPDFYLAPLFLADCHIRKGEFAQAEEALTACLEILPNHANAMLTLAQVKLQRGNVEGAVVLHRKLLSVVPDHVGAMTQCGLLLLQTGEANEAADLLKRALLLEPRDQMITDGFVAAMVLADRAEEAHALLAARLEADPRLVAVRSSLAGLLAKQERFREAIALLQAGREKMPHKYELASHLALLLATCPDADIRAPLRAAVIIERVCEETEYNDPRYLMTLAMVYGMLQRMEEAIVYTERALGLASAPEQWHLKLQIAGQLAIFKAAHAKGIGPTTDVPVASDVTTGAPPSGPGPDDPQ